MTTVGLDAAVVSYCWGQPHRKSMRNSEETTGVYPRGEGGERSEADDGGARLLVLAGARAGTAYRLERDALIGRARESDLRFDGDDVSRCHAHIRFDEALGRFMLHDLGSANGTRVNGQRIEERYLQYGDRIELGVTVILLFTHYSRLEQRALESQKLESVGQLAGGVAHDFNNLLTIVRTNLRYLEERLGEESVRADLMRESLADAKSATERAIDLTAQLVGFARGGKYKPQLVCLADLVEEAVRLFRRTFDATVEIEVDVARELHILGDRSQMMQVVMNLGINARDAMPQGGRLEVVAQAVDEEPLPGRPAEATVRLQFRDTGVGMDDETASRVFEPFFTTKARGKGTGLGLATAYGIIKNHGGNIEVESAPGKGTTFSIHLPRLPPPAEQAAVATEAGADRTTRPQPAAASGPDRGPSSAAASSSAYSSGTHRSSASGTHGPSASGTHRASASASSGARPVAHGSDSSWMITTQSRRSSRSHGVVLLVDDEDAVRDSCARILALRGFRVLHARNGLQAIEAFRANQGKINVVLLDMVMPKMGGVETFRTLREIDPSVSVVLTSGYTEAAGVDALLNEGAAGFLLKPFDPDVLLQHLADAGSSP